MSGLLPLLRLPFFDWNRSMRARDLILEQTHDLETGLSYPEPTTDEPTEEELWAMLFDGACPATDGCEVEPDGICPHGHPAWPRRMGLV